MYKMVAIDLDDTLLNDRQEIGQEDRETILKAKEAGTRLCIVTGRNYPATKKFLEMASLQDLMGCMNGAYVVDPVTERFICQFSIRGEISAEILKDVEIAGVHANLYHDNKTVCREKNSFTEFYLTETGIDPEPVGLLSEYAWSVDAGKILLLDEHERLVQIKDALEKKYSENVHFTFSRPTHLEINSIHASKGSAVRAIADYYHIARDEIIAIGNEENDVSMIRFAGLGVAMGNSSEKVKASADEVTLDNNHNGVTHVIRKHLQI